MANSSTKLQAAVGEELGFFLGQQFLSLQKEISGKFETLQYLAVRLVDKSFEKHDLSLELGISNTVKERSMHVIDKHELSAEAEASQEEITPVANFNEELLPPRRDVVPKSVPHFVSDELHGFPLEDELEILDIGDACNVLKEYRQEATHSSVVPMADIQTTFLFESRTNAGSVTSQQTFAKQVSPPTSIAARTSKRTGLSRATDIWKYGPRASLRPSTKEMKPQKLVVDFMEVMKAALFTDPAGMKEKMRNELLHPTHQVSNMYKEKGLAQSIARSDWFEVLTMTIIFLNAVWMAVDVDMNGAKTLLEADVVFIVMDNFFCTYFFIELLIRFWAFQVKTDCFSDPWFCFDMVCEILMVIETWIMTIVLWVLGRGISQSLGDASLLRIVRLVRFSKITRVAKLFHLFPELVTMVRGFKFAARTVFLCFCMVIIVIYVSALIFREFTFDQEVGQKYFNSVPSAMATLLFQGTMPDVEPWIEDIAKGQLLIGVLGVLFIFLTTFTLMNMLVGVIVGVVSEIAESEKERRTIAFVKKELSKVCACPEIDIDMDGTISQEEFEILLTHPLSVKAFSTVGVDAIGLVDVSGFIFSKDDDERLSFAEFVELILNLRGSNTATVKDIIDLRMFLTAEFLDVENKMAKQIQELTQVSKEGTAAQRNMSDGCRDPKLKTAVPTRNQSIHKFDLQSDGVE